MNNNKQKYENGADCPVFIQIYTEHNLTRSPRVYCWGGYHDLNNEHNPDALGYDCEWAMAFLVIA